MTSKYIRGQVLGQGTWGCVYEARSIANNSKVAIKRIEAKNDGLDFTALREVKYLQELKYGVLSPFVVKLEEVFVSGNALHLVLEYCPFDLSKLIYDKSLIIQDCHVKCLMHMFLQSLLHCHSHFIVHRDLKPSNLLIRSNGQLVLADFGLARNFGSPVPMTTEVVTRWYKPPELLFGSTFYSCSVDIWSAGCIFAELFLREPLFPGCTDTEQLSFIFNVIGTPTDLVWPDSKLLPNFIEFETRPPVDFDITHSNNEPYRMILNKFPQHFAFVVKFLELDPIKRISASDGLLDQYFQQEPLPCQSEEIPTPIF